MRVSHRGVNDRWHIVAHPDLKQLPFATGCRVLVMRNNQKKLAGEVSIDVDLERVPLAQKIRTALHNAYRPKSLHDEDYRITSRLSHGLLDSTRSSKINPGRDDSRPSIHLKAEHISVRLPPSTP